MVEITTNVSMVKNGEKKLPSKLFQSVLAAFSFVWDVCFQIALPVASYIGADHSKLVQIALNCPVRIGMFLCFELPIFLGATPA